MKTTANNLLEASSSVILAIQIKNSVSGLLDFHENQHNLAISCFNIAAGTEIAAEWFPLCGMSALIINEEVLSENSSSTRCNAGMTIKKHVHAAHVRHSFRKAPQTVVKKILEINKNSDAGISS